MANILISGGTGLVGSALAQKLESDGYSVSILTRKPTDKAKNHIHWNVNKDILPIEAVENADYIIHLSGESIASKRWSKSQKKELINSRIKSSTLIIKRVSEAKRKPKAIISASAIGYYGFDNPSRVFTELDPPAQDFLGNLCAEWEAEINKANIHNVRTVNVRTGIVLSRKDGALEKLNKPIKLGLGSAIGDGKQYMPWIHIDDLCEVYSKSIKDDSMSGAYNAVSPQHIVNKEFIKQLAKLQRKKILMPKVPGFLLRILFGEMSQILLQGNKVSSDKLLNTGFNFKYPDLRSALDDLINTAKTRE